MNLSIILLELLIGEISIIVLWKSIRKVRSKRIYGVRETDLRLTYKRFREIYPNNTISYSEYKKLQTRKAYKKAISSMTIERMVR